MKKGFTLVELIAVIIILAVIASITYPTVSNSIKNSKEKAYNVQVESIVEAAHKWSVDNATNLSETDATRVHISDLISNGYITKTNNGKLYNPVDDTEMTGCVVINYSNEYNQYLYDYDSECKVLYIDNSGANTPVLYTNMIPVKYDGTNWVYADIYSEWYNYDNKQWANAVVLISSPSKTYSVGDTIAMSDISQMYVWIPRYKYTIFNGNNESAAAQEINAVFERGTASTGTVSCTDAVAGSGSSSETCTDTISGSVTNGTSTYTHPAFTFGTTSLTGFWVGKFETGNVTTCTATNYSVGTACDVTTLGIQIKPNVTSWRGARVSTFYTTIASISTTYGINIDSHMMKNMEWGAVAYLTNSKYGLGTTDIGINNNSNYITGCGAAATSSSSSTCNTYNTTGVVASTTGNIYGVYDMSGGVDEYVMGNIVTSSNAPEVGYNSTDNSGFTGVLSDGTTYSGIDFPNSKYYDLYTYDSSSNATHSRGKLGDATKETLVTYGNTIGGWYSDCTSFPYSGDPWFVRGGGSSGTPIAGMFSFGFSNGSAYNTYSARVVLAGEN